MDTRISLLASGNARSAPFDLPPTDVAALGRELAARGPEAALPQNLTDAWLRVLVRDIVVMNGSHGQMAVNILVLALVAAQNPDVEREGVRDGRGLFESEPLSSYLRGYQLALISELVDRQVGVHDSEYTVEGFFKEVTSRRQRNKSAAQQAKGAGRAIGPRVGSNHNGSMENRSHA